jgi:hypothetical protein
MKKIRKISLEVFDQLSVSESAQLYGGTDINPVTSSFLDVTPSVDINSIKITPPPSLTTVGASSSSGNNHNTVSGSIKYDGKTDTATGTVSYEYSNGNWSVTGSVTGGTDGNWSVSAGGKIKF